MVPTGKERERPLVLLGEAQAILALDIATELEEAGFAVAGPIATCADLRLWTAFARPNAAILHLNLRDGSCLTEAAALARGGIPVAVFTNADRTGGDPSLTWFHGPVEPRVLIHFLRARTGAR